MGTSESTLRTAATLIVLDRRNLLSKVQLDYISTDEFKKFYHEYGPDIKRRSCDIYGIEMIELLRNGRVSPLEPIVEEISRYDCKDYRSPNIYEAVNMMINSKNDGYFRYYSKLGGYITFDAIIQSIITGDKNLYNILKEPVARIPKEEKLFDKKDIVSMTKLDKMELGSDAIFVAFNSLSMHPNSADRIYLFWDIPEYVKQIGYLSRRDTANLFNELANMMKNGNLHDWKYNDYPSKYFEYSQASKDDQINAYQKIIGPVLEEKK